jgi:hypothetical protein
VSRLDRAWAQIKVGETITPLLRQHRHSPEAASEPAVDTSSNALTKATGGDPAAMSAVQRTITATIVAIDRNARPSRSRARR